MNKSDNRFLYILLTCAMILSVAVMSVSLLQYRKARADLSMQKKALETSTAAWQKTNEEKLIIQRELKTVKNSLREADLTIQESEERAAELRDEIEILEKEIEALRNAVP